MSYILKAFYTIIYVIAFPLILLRFLWRNLTDQTGRRKAGPRRRFFERLGFSTAPAGPDGVVFHMVSVGEALGAINLVKVYQIANPTAPITVTCTTQQGSKIIQDKLGDTVNHCYLPYDLPIFLNAFVRRIRPRTFIILETELWPNLISVCFANNIATLLFNARLSEKSYNGYAKLRPLVKSMLHQFTHVSCQSPADADRFEKLGLAKSKITVTGNLKFDINIDDAVIAAGNALKTQLFNNRRTWIAASTHPGEDEIILAAHKTLCEKTPDLLLILAPRHIDRTDSIRKLAATFALPCSIHSTTNALDASCAVYLVDTMGELMKLYASSDLCFVGGSLIKHGGHNPIEPGMLHKAIIAGPHNHNFQTIYDQLTQCEGVMFVSNTNDLVEVVETLLSDLQQREKLADNAYRYVNSHRGATQRSVNIIDQAHQINT